MKTESIGFLVSMLFICATIYPVASAITNTNEIIYEINAGPYEIIENENGFHTINMIGEYGMLNSPGDPALPEKIIEFRVPDMIDWDSLEFTLEIKEFYKLEETYNIVPCPPLEPAGESMANDFTSNQPVWGYEKVIVDLGSICVIPACPMQSSDPYILV